MGSGLSSTTHHRSSSSSAASAAASLRHPPAPPPPQPQAAAAAPALVVAPDGSLREFAPAAHCPASAADALAGNAAGRFFLCSADALYFGAEVPALAADEPLRAGQIYFLLPADALARPLSSADMAALAVRASEALAARAAGQRGGRRGRGRPRARGGLVRARVVPAPYADGDEEVNEKLNQRTLGGFETASLGQARKIAGAKRVAAAVRPPVMRRALSTIEEDAE
ncbi:hypothetical protein U9M48_026935 [Paspalum notatum var. saurae]|uniref:Uncharacterized protein n=1 Tax=Paspalum notatum var. saurae TaxID=547442 RepID=A0AAQ3TVJ0_PASNO